jgi:hypothetical protein
VERGSRQAGGADRGSGEAEGPDVERNPLIARVRRRRLRPAGAMAAGDRQRDGRACRMG